MVGSILSKTLELLHYPLQEIVKSADRELGMTCAVIGDIQLRVAVAATGDNRVLARREDHVR